MEGKAKPLPLDVVDGVVSKPCVGSGYCCKKAPCVLGVEKHGQVAPCPSLVFKDGRYWCGLVEDAKSEEEKQHLINILGIGAGCCSPLNSDRAKMIRGKENADAE